MYKGTLDILVSKALTKEQFLNKDGRRYFVAAMMAGIYLGFAYFFTIVLGVAVKGAVSGAMYKVAIAATFTLALNLIVFAGSELFTGNNMLMAASALNKTSTLQGTIKLWVMCYLGNFVGSIIIALLLVAAKSPDASASELMISLTVSKISYAPTSMFFKAILCNMMVCLGVLCAYVMKEETAKLIMMFWCIFAFVLSGYEHSIANMFLFSISWMLDTARTIDPVKIGISMTIVTLGNIIGGASIGAIYYYLGSLKD